MHQIIRFGHRSKDSAFHLDRIDSTHVEGSVTGGSGIFQYDTVESPIIGFAHGRGHAHIGGDTDNDQVLDSFVSQKKLEIRV